jgi:hypothetical protein
MKKYVDIRVTAISETDLNDFLVALRKIQYCGDVGINRLIPIQVDGDGSGQINIEIYTNEPKPPKFKNLREVMDLEDKYQQRILDGDDFKIHYIGE